MFLRTHHAFYARLMTALVVASAVIASVFTTTSTVQAATPTNGVAVPNGVDSVRALELQGFLAGQGDAHYLGLEPVEGAPAIVITLVYRTSDDALLRDGVNFSVLAQDGMQAYLTGTPVSEAAVTEGRVLRAGPDGTIVQASLSIDAQGGYTVIVHNSWHDPIRYMLSVHGGTLVDEGGQTLLHVPAEPGTSSSSEADEPLGKHPHVTAQPEQTIPVVARETLDVRPSATHTGVASGSLDPMGDRHEFVLQPDPTDGEVTVHLNYRVDGGFVSTGVINFWVLTQDGLRLVNQGAFLAELNLATGRPDATTGPGQMAATVRLGATDTYALIVFNESAVSADFALEVHGANLLPSSDNGNVAGILTNAGVSPEPAAMAVVQP